MSIKGAVATAGVLTSLVTATLTIWFIYSKKPDLCNTSQCVSAASLVLNSMDPTADPCNDFYQYACGGWIKNNPIPDDQPTINHFIKADQRKNRILNDVLSQDYTNDREAIKKTKIFYRACMNEEAIELRGAQPALNMIKGFGGMPLFEGSFDEKSFHLEKFLAMIKNEPYDIYEEIGSPLIEMGQRIDDKNSSRYTLILSAPYLAFPTEDFYLTDLRNSSIPAYRKYMQEYLAALWQAKEKDVKSSNYNEEKLNLAVEEIIQFETDMAEAMVSFEKEDDQEKDDLDFNEHYTKMSLQEMKNRISPDFNWFEFVKQIMSRANKEVKPTTEVVIYGKSYLTKLPSLIKKHGNRITKNYILWRKLQLNVHLLSKKFRDTEAPFRKAITGTSVEKPRYQTCTYNINNRMPMTVAALYVKAAFPEENKQMMKSMSTDIFKTFKTYLSSLDWMDDRTKKIAEMKADKMKQLMAYPDYIIDEDDPRLDLEYKDISVSSDEYFETYYDAQKFQMNEKLRKFSTPVDRNEWLIPPAIMDTVYDLNLNAMVFPAAILQSPFYDPGNTYAMNYGAIGSGIAHQMTQGFDEEGAQFDPNGNLKNWWSKFSQTNFAKKSECFRKQYGRFLDETSGFYVDGDTTVRKNIADSGGVRQSYDAYQLWKKDNADKEFSLPGLEDFAPEQLFFLGNAQHWCESNRPEYAKLLILTQPTSPSKLRMLGAYMNFEKFGEVYGCKRGKDRLYPSPEDTCRVW